MVAIDQIEREIDFAHSPERVWRAVTEPEEMSRWFSDQVQGILDVGEELVFTWDEYGTASGRIETIEPPETFAFRWRANNISDDQPMTAANSTLVTFTVRPTDSGARLSVTESGFAELPEALRSKTFRENSSGWESELADLQAYFAGAA